MDSNAVLNAQTLEQLHELPFTSMQAPIMAMGTEVGG